jgi:hypothetical protein
MRSWWSPTNEKVKIKNQKIKKSKNEKYNAREKKSQWHWPGWVRRFNHITRGGAQALQPGAQQQQQQQQEREIRVVCGHPRTHTHARTGTTLRA